MSPQLLAFLAAAIGVASNYTGASFIAGILFPTKLGFLYSALPTMPSRLLPAVLTYICLGNFLIAFAIRQDAAVASPTSAVTAALSLVIIAVVAKSARFSVEIACATIGLMLFAFWLSLAVQKASS